MGYKQDLSICVYCKSVCLCVHVCPCMLQSKELLTKKLQEVQKTVKNADWSGVAGRLSQNHS